jgi:hypothetical protein
MIKTIEELGEELCQYCRFTEYGERKANTNPHNLCEGRFCDEAYEYYLEAMKEEENE